MPRADFPSTLRDCSPPLPDEAGVMGRVVHVLYAEDNPVDAELTRAHFERHAPDLKLEIVPSGAAFLPLAHATRHALHLIGHRSARGDGLEVLKQLARERAETPIVFLTDAGDARLAATALRLGAAEYISKRGDYLDTLPDKLRKLMSRQLQPWPVARVRPRRLLVVDAHMSGPAAWIKQLTAHAPQLAAVVTPTAVAAVEQLETDADFDLVIALHSPPAFDGLELLRRLRETAHRKPALLVSPDEASEAAVVDAFKLGASDFVFGFQDRPAELALRVELAIERHELSLADERAAAELAERQRTVAALRESEKRLNLALEAGRIGLWTWHVGTGHTQFSPRWKAQLGYEEHEIRNDSAEWESRCHPDDLPGLQTLIQRYLAEPWPDFTTEYRMRHKEGTWRWFMLHADLELDERNRPVRMLGSQIDITALKQQQSELAGTSARLQQLSRRLLHVQELERRHLARELHDEIGQVLTVAKMHLQSLSLTPETAALAPHLKDPVALLDRLLAQVRSLSLDLRPPLLDDLGLVASLHWLVQQHEARAATPRIFLEADPLVGRCDPLLETACFRIAQEAFTNALRHAQAKNIHVSVRIQEGSLRLGVVDDGTGFDAAAARQRSERGGSLGLLGMHERALLAGGSLTLLSAPRRGTEVEAIFPLGTSPEAR